MYKMVIVVSVIGFLFSFSETYTIGAYGVDSIHFFFQCP